VLLLFLLKKVVNTVINFNENMSFFILNRGKKSSKFWQVIVNYGRFVGFKEQLEFFEFCYEPIFLRKCAFLGKTQNFQARFGKFSHDPICFCAQKS
jgi:hypothetical protein